MNPIKNYEIQSNLILINFVRRSMRPPEHRADKFTEISDKRKVPLVMNEEDQLSIRNLLEADIVELMTANEKLIAENNELQNGFREKFLKVERMFEELLNLGVSPDKLINIPSLLDRWRRQLGDIRQ